MNIREETLLAQLKNKPPKHTRKSKTTRIILVLVLCVALAILINSVVFKFTNLVSVGYCELRVEYVALKNSYNESEIHSLALKAGYESELLPDNYINDLSITTDTGWSLIISAPESYEPNWRLDAYKDSCTQPDVWRHQEFKSILENLNIESEWFEPSDIKEDDSISIF